MRKAQQHVRTAIAELQRLPRSELIVRFRRLYRSEPPKQISRDLLLRAISSHLQQTASGGHSTALQRRLRSLASELRQTGASEPKANASFTAPIKPGNRLVREWQGVVHEVTALDEGFVYRNQRYRSLSQIARAITGTRWSGPAFFGLRTARVAKGAGNATRTQSR